MDRLKKHLYEQGVKEMREDRDAVYIRNYGYDLTDLIVGFTIRDLCYQYEYPHNFTKPDTYFYGPLGFSTDGTAYESLEFAQEVIGNDKYLRIYAVLFKVFTNINGENEKITMMYEEPYEEALMHMERKSKQLEINRNRIKLELEAKGMKPILVGQGV